MIFKQKIIWAVDLSKSWIRNPKMKLKMKTMIPPDNLIWTMVLTLPLRNVGLLFNKILGHNSFNIYFVNQSSQKDNNSNTFLRYTKHQANLISNLEYKLHILHTAQHTLIYDIK